MKILIVDDREDNRYLLETMVRGAGYETVSAGNGREALEMLAREPFDLVISDILMPVMDGFELCRTMRKSISYRDIPFMFYTATYTGPKDHELALKVGADKFVTKPCEPDVLLKMVEEVLGESKDHNHTLGTELPEDEIMKLYNERLVRKLEQKMEQLEQEMKDRIAAESAQLKSEEQFRLFAELAPVGIVISDTHGRVIYCNKRFTDMLGYTREDIPTVQQWWPLAYPDEKSRQEIRKRWEESAAEARISEENIFSMETDVTCRDGQYLRVEFRLTSTQDYNFIVFVDVTQRFQLEQQLRQAQKLESVGRLAGGIAHDFNNMLGVILGRVEMALGLAAENSELKRDLEEIKDAALRSADLTRQLLMFARKQVIEPKVIDLNVAVENSLKMITRLIGEDIELQWHPGNELPPVKMDPSQLHQLTANLCINAKNSIEKAGKIILSTRHVFLKAADFRNYKAPVPGEYVEFQVADDGCGMDDQTKEQMFEPFFTTSGKGTGLGLATVYGIVKQNNGFIEVVSELGKGTEITLRFPACEGVLEYDTVDVIQDAVRSNNIKVLLVEDNESILKMVESMLSRLGYSSVTAGSPEEALVIAEKKQDFDMLITDVVMPGMNGKELAEALKLDYPDLLVLYMSGYTSDIIANHGIIDKDVEFIQKPFSMKELDEKLRAVSART